MIHKAFQTLGVNTMKNDNKKIKDDEAGNKGADENAPPAATTQEKGQKYYPFADYAVLDFSTSCTREDAVARMLGWMRGHIRNPNLEGDITQDSLVYAFSLKHSLEDHLLELRCAALDELSDLIKDGATDVVLNEKTKSVLDFDALINKAGTYLCDIDDELSQSDSPKLRIDRHATDTSGDIHITLSSLDLWAKKKYPEHKITILGTPEFQCSKDDMVDRMSARKADSRFKDGLSQKKASGLYVTFALLLNAYADKGKFLINGKPNVSGIATHIAELATKHTGNEPMEDYAQSYEAIKDRIEAAMAVLKEMLPKQ